jgi:hypothetical protein
VIPRLAYWFGPLQQMGRLPAIDVGSRVQAAPRRTVASSTSVGGVPRRDVLGVGMVWRFQWERLLVSEFGWLFDLWDLTRYGVAPDLYVRDAHAANLLPAAGPAFPAAVIAGPSAAVPAWSVGPGQLMNGVIPVEPGESLTVSAQVRSAAGAGNVTIGWTTVPTPNGVVTSPQTTVAVAAASGAFAEVAHTSTVGANTVAVRPFVAAVSVNPVVARPRLTRGGEPATYEAPGGTGRVVMDDLTREWVSATEADVTLRLLEAGYVVGG